MEDSRVNSESLESVPQKGVRGVLPHLDQTKGSRFMVSVVKTVSGNGEL